MPWIENEQQYFNLRHTKYNNSVAMTKTSINYMLDSFDTIFNTINNFTEEVSSLQLYPFLIFTETVPEGTVPTLFTTRGQAAQGVTAYNIDARARYLNFGEFHVEPKFNNFADYKGYTQIKAFLPFVGYVDIDVNEVMGKWLQFRLFTDFQTGKGLFIVGVSEESVTHASPIYPQDGEDDNIRVISTYECDVGIDIPLGKSDIGDIKRNMLLGAVKMGVGVAASVATANLGPATTVASEVTTYNISGRSTRKGSRMKPIKTGTETTEKTTVHHRPVNKAQPVAEAIEGSIDVLNRLTIHGHADRVNDAGLMVNMSNNVRVVIYRPKFAELPVDFGSLYGYPLGQVKTLAELTGYTEINAIHIEGLGFEKALQSEIAMLEEQFTDGIIL